jgi:hypothetical protein
MIRISRRAFLASLAATLPAAAFVRRAHAASIDELAASPRSMRALGEAILPHELGSAGVTKAVNEFERWIAGYREGAELSHGYGTSTLRWAGPTPATAWAAQLSSLDRRAQRANGRTFAALPLSARRALVQSDLDSIKATGIPALARAPHVALALLAHYYSSSEAADLCYRAQIGRQNCRPLAAQTRKPLPLAGLEA